jgi:uncharacterized membrane protein
MEAVKEKKLKQLTMIVYALQALSFLVGFSCIAGVIINYIKQKDVEGTWLASHFRWQIRTFWFSLLFYVIGIATFILLIGIIILIATTIWYIYRIAKGWIYLNDNKPMYEELAIKTPPATST